jgi:hypothetical protein
LPEPDPIQIESAYRSAITIAGEGGLRLTELQALTRLVLFQRSFGKSPDAGDDLAAVYATFPPGLQEPDLIRSAQILGH